MNKRFRTMVDTEIKCSKCGGECIPTGVTIFTCPVRKEYYCCKCGHKFSRVEDERIVNAPQGYQRRPDLKGCFNCMNYTNVDLDYSKFTCLKCEGLSPEYTDVCDLWEKFKEVSPVTNGEF